MIKEVSVNEFKDEKLYQSIISYYESLSEDEHPSEKANKLHKYLEDKHGTGWCIIIGKHYKGICPYIKDYYMRLLVEEDYILSIYKIYLPL